MPICYSSATNPEFTSLRDLWQDVHALGLAKL